MTLRHAIILFMSRVRQLVKQLGKSGTAFVILVALWVIFYLTGQDAAMVLSFLALIPLAAILAFRAFRFARHHTLWSVGNRLLFVYGLFGVLPLLLLFALVGLGAWALMDELAIYLASSALDRYIEGIKSSVETVRQLPVNQRPLAVPEVAKAFQHSYPGRGLELKDADGEHQYPLGTPPLNVPSGWGNVDGLLVMKGRFYGWAHYKDSNQEITSVVPLSDETVEDLVPHLGAIALFEASEKSRHNDRFATAGALSVRDGGTAYNPDFKISTEPSTRQRGHHSLMPPAMNRFDIPVVWPSTRPHYHLDTPGKSYDGVLLVYSRPSAVFRSFFSNSEELRGVLFDAVIAVALIFLGVELVAIWIGVNLSRRITTAVNQLYEGTRRVIHGDFHHRILVAKRDQLGELADSFNQMTGNLERLLVIEKEKERLETELQIAREVQSQLYPKEAPPSSGLKLTVRCDPARMVSGDYYDYAEIGKGRLAFAIGDVAGKGISAALLMATLQAALRAQITHYLPLKENDCTGTPQIDAATLVSSLNRQIYAHTSPEKYATFFFALFEQQTRALTYTNAGHLSPLLFRNGDVVRLDSNG